MVGTGAIRLRSAPKFGDREIFIRRFRIWGPFGLIPVKKTGTTLHQKLLLLILFPPFFH